MEPQARRYSWLDQCVIQLDQTLRAVFSHSELGSQPSPADDIQEAALTPDEQRRITALMRINHVGEVCAQALYQGQAITARSDEVRDTMREAALEENDHLAWCQQRLIELNGHTSYLNVVWYLGSLSFGLMAGVAGDRWSLGFLAETEHQVAKHLESHLTQLPEHDARSRAVITQMREDELKHATTAVSAGAAELPGVVKAMMSLSSTLMTSIAYYI